MFLSLILVYLCYLLLFICGTLCLATGIYYVAEVVEEYATFTKKILRGFILSVILIHILLMIFENFPISYLSFGIFAQLVYSFMLKDFPMIDLLSWRFLLSCATSIINHGIWFRHFTTEHYPFDQVLSFFVICVWLVPFGFFISISTNEYSLPTTVSSSDVYFDANSLDIKSKKKSNRVLSFFNFLKQKKSEILPSSIISMKVQ
eukprot:TRINITY_DN5749_c0_g1_i2.p1 TRINITY_DN5749_c0_g1~~TRINITY_DN5749_c0_g1_i2.p1  ORF type:complete len:204 (-),score=42.35 TRINITY_DN5749_c0_g1_i2:20-631(-)